MTTNFGRLSLFCLIAGIGLVVTTACSQAFSSPVSSGVIPEQIQTSTSSMTYSASPTVAEATSTSIATITAAPLSPTKPTAPISTRTPSSSVAWKAPATAVQLKLEDSIESLRWDNNDTVALSTFFGGEWIVDTQSGSLITPTPFPTYAGTVIPIQIPSPDGRYYLECNQGSLLLYRSSDKQLISETDLVLDCYSDIDTLWAPSSRFLALNSNGAVYVWRPDGSAPSLLPLTQPYFFPVWSPDSSKLFLLGGMGGSPDTITVTIFDLTGRPLLPQPLEVFWKLLNVNWITGNVIQLQFGCGTECQYDEYRNATTGQLIVTVPYMFNEFQRPLGSLDNRWLFIDKGKQYLVLDLQSGTARPINHEETTYLKFSIWAPDNKGLYVISRPVSETAAMESQLPFGLLLIDPKTLASQMVFEQAMDVQWNPQGNLAWVLFPGRDNNDNLSLTGSIFSPSDNIVIGRVPIAANILYGNPALGDLTPATWSNNGQSLAFGDSAGNLAIISTSGKTRVLASGLPVVDWPRNIRLGWSPDDKKLLVEYGVSIWVVEVPPE